MGRNYLTICEVRVFAAGSGGGGKSYVYNPPEHSRRYSSIWGNNRIGTGHARSRLNSHQAWSARHNHRNQWLQMNMHGYKWVKGIVMQGRRHSGQHQHRQLRVQRHCRRQGRGQQAANPASACRPPRSRGVRPSSLVPSQCAQVLPVRGRRALQHLRLALRMQLLLRRVRDHGPGFGPDDAPGEARLCQQSSNQTMKRRGPPVSAFHVR